MKVDGSRIRELRQKSGRTLQVLSEDAAISPSFLSQVERGLSEPSLDSAFRIAGSLNVPVKAIALDEDERDRDQPVSYGGMYRDRFVTPDTAETLQVLESVLEPGPQVRKHAYAHPENEEFIFVIDGVLEITVGEQVHRIRAGDSLLIDPRIRHSYANPGSTPVRWLWVSAKSPRVG